METLNMPDPYCSPGRLNLNPGRAFREVCRSVLDPKSLSFVAANAPSEVVTSFEVHQQRLASFSLKVASTMLVRRLTERENLPFHGSLSRIFQASKSKVQSAFLLAACTVGRVGLNLLRALRLGLPRHLQLSVSANILHNVGNLLINMELVRKPIADIWSDRERVYPDAIETVSVEESEVRVAAEDIFRALTISLPNALSRLIFLATLRDNNSGHYFHPEVARRFSADVADQAMLACHRHVYEQVVALALEDLTDQLDAYIATVRAPKERLIESWTKLRAYRATIPIDADPISSEIFFMKVEVAVAILEARLPAQLSARTRSGACGS
jgi:hypothetical protein